MPLPMTSDVQVSLLAIAVLVVVPLVLPVTRCSEQVQQSSPTEASSPSVAAPVRHHHHAAGRSNGTRLRHRASSHGRREHGGLAWDAGEEDGDSSGSSSSWAVCEMEISCDDRGGRRHDHDDYTSTRLPVRLPLEVLSRRGAAPLTARIAFFVGLSENIGPVTDSSPVMFDRVVTNVGAAYDSLTGRFTAPVNGTYQFNVVIAAQGRQKAAVNVVKNGAMVATVWAESIPFWSSASNIAILELEQTDQVWLMLLTRASYLHGYMYSTFSGFLIFSHD